MAIEALQKGIDDKKEISYWENEYKRCTNLRKPYEEIWYMNLAFYFSKQWVVWQKTTTGNSRLLDPATPRNRVRLISNRIKPIIRDELTKLIKEEPQFYVMPNTTDPTDVAAAQAGESIAEYVINNRSFNKIRRQATFWALITGTSYIKTTCPGDDQEILFERNTPFHILVPNLDDEEIQTQPYVMQCRGIPRDVVEALYKVDLAPDMNNSGTSLEARFLQSLGIKNTNIDNTETGLIYVKEIWIKPSARYKNGALLVIANGKIIYRYSDQPDQINPDTGMPEPIIKGDSFPYDHGQYPFEKIVHTASGRFYGTSTIEDCIPLQKEYNKTRSQIIESKNRMAKPQMTYTKGAIDVNKMTSEVGLMIPVQPGFDPPKPIQIEPLPNYVLQELDLIIRDMDEIAGRNEISRGSVPTGIEAASAISYLSEQNDSKIYNTVASIEEALEAVGKQVLSLVQQFWTKGKIIAVVSRNNAWEAEMFAESSLNSNFDLRVEAGSMAPKSKTAHQAFIVDLMDKGILPPEKGLRYLQMNETNRLYDELQVDAKQAKRENYKMSQGQPVVTNEFDNDAAHIYEHELYMKSQEYEALDPQIQQIFIVHDDQHKAKVVQANGPIGNPTGNNSPVPADQPAA
jgi:hypothetical protein